MASKMVILLVLSCLLVVGKGTAAASNADVVFDVNNQEVRYGQYHNFFLSSPDHGQIASPFSFGLGVEGQPVRTDTPVTLARNNKLMACKKGKVEWVEQTDLITQEQILHVQAFDPAQHLYLLTITETPGVFVTDSRLSSCAPSADAARFQFRNIGFKAGVAQADTVKLLMEADAATINS